MLLGSYLRCLGRFRGQQGVFLSVPFHVFKVAGVWAVLGVFGWFWAVLGGFGGFWVVLEGFGRYHRVPSSPNARD